MKVIVYPFVKSYREHSQKLCHSGSRGGGVKLARQAKLAMLPKLNRAMLEHPAHLERGFEQQTQ